MTESKKDIFIAGIRAEMQLAYQELVDKEVIIFGTGSYGQMLLRELNRMGLGKCVVAFCDNDESKWGGTCLDTVVQSVDTLISEHPNAVYVIASSAQMAIMEQLKDKPVHIMDKSEYLHLLELQLTFIQSNRELDLVSYAGHWFSLYEDCNRKGDLQRYMETTCAYMEDAISRQVLQKRMQFFLSGDVNVLKEIPYSSNMYFDKDYLPIQNEEVLFDCGAYNGDSLYMFWEYTKGKYKSICAFEPDDRNYNDILRLIESCQMKNVDTYQVATGKENAIVSFSNDGSGGAKIIDEGESQVQVVRLDDYIDRCPTFIKMDIEGAELDTLRGAEQTIKTLKPKLAISIYHKWLDFYEIPAYLKILVPEYKFKVRHHSRCLYDTVLYAYVEE